MGLVDILLVPGPGILEPDLHHPLAEAGYFGNPLQVLPIRVTVEMEVCLKDVDLLVSECCAVSLRFPLLIAFVTSAAVSICI